MADSSRQLGFVARTMLVLLRITIGWHFLYAGLWKLENPEFSSQGFLSQSKGPLADKFQQLLPDPDGRQRLDPANQEQFAEHIDRELKRFSEHYQITQEQQALAERIVAVRKTQLDEYLAEHRAEIEDYLHELTRLDAARAQPTRDIPFQQKRIWDKKTELQGKANGWLAEIDRINEELDRDLNGLLDADQRRRGSPVTPLTTVQKVDLLVKYSNIAIGACLIAGLFTRFASLSGALFLLSIVLAQPDWPGLYPPPHPSTGRSLIVTKEFIEMMALFALAATHVGRWGGLDFFIHQLIVRPLFGKRESR